MPIWWLVVASTKDTAGLFSSPAFWFDGDFALFANIAELFTHQGGIYWRWLGNSFLYAFAGGIGATILAVLAGYGFAKYDFRGRNGVFTVILGSVMVPLTALVIPTFMLLSQYGIINTPWAVILPSLLSPFGVYLMRVYTQDAVPDEMLEAARIDGASEWRIFTRLVLPTLQPVIVTLALFVFLGSWNDFLWPLIVLSDQDLYTLPVALAALSREHVQDNELMMAGSVITTLPVLILFLALQRYYLSGLMAGSVKG